VHEVPEDLATVVRVWERLLTAVKAEIVAMVKAVQPQELDTGQISTTA